MKLITNKNIINACIRMMYFHMPSVIMGMHTVHDDQFRILDYTIPPRILEASANNNKL